ncbi:MAG: hypothetical protein BBJ57_02020 [Desulfobacterales bacterium PC51MH44]|nr:MAG: hypothetical protein BBJ57_02020 [Desulfobacterales bacterium PC51MH44]
MVGDEVYVLLADYGYDGDSIIGLFKNKGKAEKTIEKIKELFKKLRETKGVEVEWLKVRKEIDIYDIYSEPEDFKINPYHIQ